jgi:hypothetical protein
MNSEETTVAIGGLKVHIYGLETLRLEIPVTGLFLLHGRCGDHSEFKNTIARLNLKFLNLREDLKRQLLNALC